MKLNVLTPRGEQFEVPLSTTPIVFGRAEDCDFVLRHDAEVSRHHARIWLDESNRIVVQDNGSKNGTRVDDGELFRRDKRYAFQAIRIGEHDLRIISDGKITPKPVTFVADAGSRSGDTQFFPSSRQLDLSAQRLQMLIQLGERIAGRFERTELLEEALNVCCEALGFERGLIVLKAPRGETEPPVTRNIGRDESGAFKVSRTLINRALVDGERAIVNNPATDLDGLTESLVRFPICSALCVPILHHGEVLGVIYGDRTTQANTYQPADVDFLAAIAQQVGIGIANLRLFQDKVKAQALYHEMDRARVIQRRLLPAGPLVRGPVHIEGVNEASSACSGDYYDYFELGDERVGFIVADVTGHGLPAALVMANVQSAIRVALTNEMRLPELAARVNRLLCRNTSSSVFVTAIMGVMDQRGGALQLVNAGHPGPILINPGAARLHPCEGSLPLGVEPDESFEIFELPPTPGVNAALFFTDGLIEASDPDGKLLGIDPVLEALSALERIEPTAMIRRTRDVVRKHLSGRPNADDMTLLAIHHDPGRP